MQEHVHQHFLQRAIQIAKQPALQTKIGLRAGEQILDQQAESRAAADEIHHARGNRAEQESSQKNALGERGAELQVGREIAAQQGAISLRALGQRLRFVQHHFARQIARSHGVVQAFARDRIHQPAGVAHRQPAFARQAIIFPTGMFERRQHVAVERRVFVGDALLIHVLLQPRAQRLRRLALAANSHRKMPAAREHPDVAFQVRQKLDVDVILRGRHIVAERVHGVGRGPLGSHVAQRIARARCDDAEIGVELPVPRLEAPSAAAALDAQHARLLQLRAGLFGALQQHAIQIHARIDQQRTAQVHVDSPGRVRRQAWSAWMIFFGTSFSSKNGYRE